MEQVSSWTDTMRGGERVMPDEIMTVNEAHKALDEVAYAKSVRF